MIFNPLFLVDSNSEETSTEVGKSLENFFENMSHGGQIVWTIAISLVIIALSIYLVFSIKREIKRKQLEKEKSSANENILSRRMVMNALEEYIRTYRLTNEATVMIFELSNANELTTSFGKKYEGYLREKVIQNVLNMMPKNVIFGEYSLENDSYIVLLRGTISKKKIMAFAEALVDTIERPIEVPNMDIQTSYACYLGVAMYPSQAITAHDLVSKADLALYMNHKTPNERFSIYSSNFDETEKQNLVYYNEIKAAIKNKEFTLYYQPIVDKNDVVGFETLIRWQHPTLGVLAPNKFLSVLENSGDILWVGRWSINEICVFYNENRELFSKKDIFFSINLSIKQLLNENVVSEFNDVVKKYNVPSRAICIEIEEYALYEKYQTIQTTIEAFKKYNYRVAIDHFGVDSNNIKKLENQKPFMIKINSDAIIEAGDSFVTKKMVSILTDSCKELGIQICSLMIENQVMFDQLAGYGVSYFEGYFISSPIEANAAVAFAKNRELVDNKDSQEVASQPEETTLEEPKEE